MRFLNKHQFVCVSISFLSTYFVFFKSIFFRLNLVVITSGKVCLALTYYVSNGTLHSAHSLGVKPKRNQNINRELSSTHFPNESTVVTTARFCNEQMHNSKLLSVLYVYTEMPTWVNKNMGDKAFKREENGGISATQKVCNQCKKSPPYIHITCNNKVTETRFSAILDSTQQLSKMISIWNWQHWLQVTFLPGSHRGRRCQKRCDASSSSSSCNIGSMFYRTGMLYAVILPTVRNWEISRAYCAEGVLVTFSWFSNKVK